MPQEATGGDQDNDAVGSASFLNDEAEFIASLRAHEIAAHRWFGTRSHRWAAIAWGHVVFLMGLLLASVWPTSSPELRWHPGVLVMTAFGLGLTALGGWTVVFWLYGGNRRRMRRAFREAPTAGLRLRCTLTPARFVSHSAKSDASNDWSLFESVVELRDGYLLLPSHRRGTWIPKRALEPPFDAAAAAAFLRSRIANYRFLDRTTRDDQPIAPSREPEGLSSPKATGPIVGAAAYRLTQDEFRRAWEAALTASRPWRRSRFGGVLFFGGWHLLLAAGLYGTFVRSSEPDGRMLAILAPVLAIASAFVLWRGLYGASRQIHAGIRSFPLLGDELSFSLTPDRFITHNRLADSSVDWSFLRDVVEFSDGFVVRLKRLRGGYWIPDHALQAPFDHQQAAAFLRSRGVKYRVIDRAVGRGA